MRTRQLCVTCLCVHYDHAQTNDSSVYPYHLSFTDSSPFKQSSAHQQQTKQARKPHTSALSPQPKKANQTQHNKMGCGPSKQAPLPRRGQYISYPKQQQPHHLAPLPPKPTRAPNARLDGPFQMAYPVRKSQMPMARKSVPKKVPRGREARLHAPFQMEYPVRKSQMW